MIYGLGSLLFIFGIPTRVGWLVLGLFLTVSFVMFVTHWLSRPQIGMSLASPKDLWVEEWRAIWSCSVD